MISQKEYCELKNYVMETLIDMVTASMNHEMYIKNKRYDMLKKFADLERKWDMELEVMANEENSYGQEEAQRQIKKVCGLG